MVRCVCYVFTFPFLGLHSQNSHFHRLLLEAKWKDSVCCRKRSWMKIIVPLTFCCLSPSLSKVILTCFHKDHSIKRHESFNLALKLLFHRHLKTQDKTLKIWDCKLYKLREATENATDNFLSTNFCSQRLST